jgi:hypothetical protein
MNWDAGIGDLCVARLDLLNHRISFVALSGLLLHSRVITL